MNFTMKGQVKLKSLNEIPRPTFSINQNKNKNQNQNQTQLKENTILFDNNDMNSIKTKYESSAPAAAAIHNFKKGMVERVNIKTKGCGSCGR